MKAKTPDDLNRFLKLPKWVQDHIHTVERERDSALTALNKYVDNQTESPFSIMELECLGEGDGTPSYKQRYIQTHKMEIRAVGVALDIILRDDHIDLSWGTMEQGWSTRGSGEVCMSPYSYQAIKLISREFMRR